MQLKVVVELVGTPGGKASGRVPQAVEGITAGIVQRQAEAEAAPLAHFCNALQHLLARSARTHNRGCSPMTLKGEREW